MRKSGITKLEFRRYNCGSVAELAKPEREEYIIPGSVKLTFRGEPLHYTQVDAHGNPQISGIAEHVLIWKARQMTRDGLISSQYGMEVDYTYETCHTPVAYPVIQRLPRADVCPVCGKPFSSDDLDETDEISTEYAPGCIGISKRPRVDFLEEENAVVHEACANEYRRLRMIDDITEMVGLVFNGYTDDQQNRFHWGKDDRGMWYELIPNEYCSQECCAHRPWFLFHTPIGDIKIGWRKRVINITFMANFAPFEMKIFEDTNVTKYVDDDGERTIHAWGKDKLYDYLCRVRDVVLPEK